MSEQTAAAGPRRRAGTVVAIVLLMVMLAAVGVVGRAYVLNAPPARPLTAPVGFTIERGETLASITDRLEQVGIIRSGMMLTAIARVDGTAGTTAEGFLFPDTTDYRFFVWSGPGSESHAFTRTLSEHNEARLLHLKSL